MSPVCCVSEALSSDRLTSTPSKYVRHTLRVVVLWRCATDLINFHVSNRLSAFLTISAHPHLCHQFTCVGSTAYYTGSSLSAAITSQLPPGMVVGPLPPPTPAPSPSPGDTSSNATDTSSFPPATTATDTDYNSTFFPLSSPRFPSALSSSVQTSAFPAESGVSDPASGSVTPAVPIYMPSGSALSSNTLFPTSIYVTPDTSTSSSLPSASVSQTLPSPQQALASGHSTHVGAIAGGVIGGLFFIALLVVLLLNRKRIIRKWQARGRHRVAPSAEFIGRGTTPFSPSPLPGSPQMRAVSAYGSIAGSRVASPYGVPIQGQGRGHSIYRDDEAVVGFAGVGAGAGLAEEGIFGMEGVPPPPFTRGNFSDPLFEKLSDAARQREELYRTTSGPEGGPLPSSPRRNDSGNSYATASESQQSNATRTTRISEQELYNPYLSTYANESDNEEDMKQTSPILNWTSTASYDGGVRRSMAGEIGWAV